MEFIRTDGARPVRTINNIGRSRRNCTMRPFVFRNFVVLRLKKKGKMSIIELNMKPIVDICQKHRVKTLAVFGSVLTDRFHDDSDIDFVVDFTDVDECDYADNYLEMQDSLRNLFGREIDLLEDKAIRNSILRETINNSKQVIYG